MTRLFGIFSVLLLSCGEESKTDYTLFNSETDFFEVEVGTETTGEDQLIELHSSTGQVIVGTATLTPGSGPIGTEHRLVIEVNDNWQAQVVEAIVLVDSGERGIEEFTLQRDSADAGYYQVDIIFVGDVGEIRTDTFTIQLFIDETSTQITDTGL